ncbi:hypothetical protein CES85_3358 (plasmid) [Ochrobactrum quorumnocens]|uniref:Uncharacterized protein n=1 Tax=Ochrobactrum quorumnocens TaxID=271865 RepID=A0A248UMU8_9HYPH|nr:hypothetical protein CES85_3358 [[Ochrobactrum] quorumnocens]
MTTIWIMMFNNGNKKGLRLKKPGIVLCDDFKNCNTRMLLKSLWFGSFSLTSEKPF